MTRMQIALAILLALEFATGAFFALRRPVPPAPPQTDSEQLDALTARDLQILEANLASADDWRRLAETYLASGFFAAGEACYRQAATLEPTQADILFEWAFCLAQMGAVESSNAAFDRALQAIAPHPDEVQYFIGRNYLRLENPAQAAAAFRKAGTLPGAQYELARLLHRQGKDREAAEVLDAILSTHPRAIEPNLLRHRVSRKLGDAAAAERFRDQAEQATGKLPTPFQAQWQRLNAVRDRLGWMTRYRQAAELVQAGQRDAAAEVYRELLKVRWERTALDQLSFTELSRGNDREAIRLLEEIVAREGPSVEMLAALGDAHASKGRLDEAMALWKKGVVLRDREPLGDLLRYLLDAAKSQKDNAAAQHWEARAREEVGIASFRQRHFKEARQQLEAAVRLDPELTSAWFYLGETRREANELAAAREAYQQCLKLRPFHGRALRGLELSPK